MNKYKFKDVFVNIILPIVLIGLVILSAIGVRILQAKYIYHNMECVFAECRINIDNNNDQHD